MKLPDVASDLVLADLEAHLAARKSRAYRNHVRVWFETLVKFLEGNGLTTRPLLVPGQPLPDTFLLRRSDLTDRGFAVFQRGFHRWLGAVDTEKTDDSLLVKTLKGSE